MLINRSIDQTKDIDNFVFEAQRQHWNISHPTPGRRWCCWPPTCGSSRWPSPTTSCCPAGWSLFDPAVGHQLHEKYFKIKQIWLKSSTDLGRSTKIQFLGGIGYNTTMFPDDLLCFSKENILVVPGKNWISSAFRPNKWKRNSVRRICAIFEGRAPEGCWLKTYVRWCGFCDLAFWFFNTPKL